MIEISYSQIILAITAVWIIIRAICWVKTKRFAVKSELRLLPVYLCIVVVARFTFCPFFPADGKIQPLLFDSGRVFPPKLNLIPFVYWVDYPTVKEALINLLGNTAMFVPLGIVWPAVFKKLNTHCKTIAAGAGASLTIEILQLPFFDRTTDIDDLLLNTLGFVIGYGIYLLVKKLGRKKVC